MLVVFYRAFLNHAIDLLAFLRCIKKPSKQTWYGLKVIIRVPTHAGDRCDRSIFSMFLRLLGLLFDLIGLGVFIIY
ncbi:hypothetical protein DK880_00769 [Candidatus Cardinium hertigii]|uniref:Uncharacterized protein n=1 Tax=Candidatus Cardinium hertigii TaxID=247481 RepID=A0A2Z3L955_9BACT|nr:hypothetical protein DK880_00769 [Candidatus Cardinium hertigii]